MINKKMDMFPKTYYANILMLDEKIESWGVGEDENGSTRWMYPVAWKDDRIEKVEGKMVSLGDYNVIAKEFHAMSEMDVHNILTNLAPNFINQYEYSKDFRGVKAGES